MGDHTKVDRPMTKRYPALDKLISSARVPNSLAMMSEADKRDVLLEHAANVIQLVVNTTSHFRTEELECPGRSSSMSVASVPVDTGVEQSLLEAGLIMVKLQ